MKLTILKQTGYALTLLLLFHIKSNAQEKPGVFYAVTGKDAKDTSWLFGTYHLIKASYLNETPAVMAAFNKANNTVVEVVIDTAELAAANAMSLLKNKELKELFDSSFIDSLDAELKATFGGGIQQMNTLKPMTVMLTLSMIHLMKDNSEILNKYSGQPLDVFFAAKSKAAQKTVAPLETLRQQMNLLFNTIPDEEQAKMLQRFIRSKEQNIQMGNELVKLYFENDLEKIYALYQRTLESTGDMDYLITKRNDNWMKQLPSLIRKQSNFIAVGALHLAGPGGIVEQLRKEGYTVIAKNLQ